MIRRILAIAACVLASTLAPAQAREQPPNKALHALFEREFQRQMKEQPEAATFAGVEGHNHRLSDRSPAAIAAQRAHLKALIRELERFDARRLNAQDRVSLAMMLEDLRITDRFNAMYGPLPFAGKDGWLQVAPDSGPQHLLPALAKAAPFRDVRDYENYLQRLAAVPLALEQMTAQMREGMRSGWLPPAEVMPRVPAQFDVFIAEDVTGSPLYTPFKSFGVGLTPADQVRLEAAGRKVLAEQVRPAFAALKRFVEQEYIPACRRSLAASTLPGGKAYYALSVRDSTTTPLTPEAVHELGLREVARIEGEMDKLIASTGFKGSRAEFVRSIKADKRHYFTQPEDMLKGYRDIAKRVDAELPRLFAELPRLPYGVRAMEAFEGDNADHYSAGALDGSRAGFFEANVLSLATRPTYEMENTFLHEAMPGHHLQTARAQEIQGLPKFRRNGWYVAYGEGWALYAESLGTELGLYKDPTSRFAALSWEMVRACRLVVDTGLHAFGWTREQAIRHLVDNAGIAEGFAATEVDRYIVTPAQALGYKIGQLKIKELRERAQRTLGDRFDVRRFHNVVLDDGPVPLTVLEARVDEWIAAQRKAPARKS